MKKLLYIFVLMVLMGCDGVEKPEKPANLISEDKLADIMYDLYILNAAKGVNRRVLERHGIMPTDYVYGKHGVDSLQFAQSNTYYAFDMQAYSRIVEKVRIALEKEKEVYEALNKTDEKTEGQEGEIPSATATDSIRHVDVDTVD